MVHHHQQGPLLPVVPLPLQKVVDARNALMSSGPETHSQKCTRRTTNTAAIPRSQTRSLGSIVSLASLEADHCSINDQPMVLLAKLVSNIQPGLPTPVNNAQNNGNMGLLASFAPMVDPCHHISLQHLNLIDSGIPRKSILQQLLLWDKNSDGQEP